MSYLIAFISFSVIMLIMATLQDATSPARNQYEAKGNTVSFALFAFLFLIVVNLLISIA